MMSRRYHHTIRAGNRTNVSIAAELSDDVKLSASEYRMFIYHEIDKRRCQNRRRYQKLTL
jgi:hypothetical protein